MLLLSHAGT